MSFPSIPVLLGATASGKTAIGIELARLLNAEVISVDSRKVYRGLPVGTATPPGEWKDSAYVVEGVAHHGIGHIAPDQFYTAGDFAKEAQQWMADIFQRGKTPLLVGGTGFYFKALQHGLPPLPPRDPKLRAELEARIKEDGGKRLHDELNRVDPDAAAAISPRDPHKLIRSIEVYRLTGRPFSQWKNEPKAESPYTFVVMGLSLPNDQLNERIQERSAEMERGGMIEETAALLAQGHSPACAALDSFGYREAVQVIQGTLPRTEFLPRLIKGTKAYAKRQRTWFRTQVRPVWFDVDTTSDSHQIALKMNGFLNLNPQ